jgi:hypothetical protein
MARDVEEREGPDRWDEALDPARGQVVKGEIAGNAAVKSGFLIAECSVKADISICAWKVPR